MKKVQTVLVIIALCALALWPMLVQAQQPSSQPGDAKLLRAENAIPGHYIVVLKEDITGIRVSSSAAYLAHKHGGATQFLYRYALNGFSITLSQAGAMALSQDPNVAYVAEDSAVSIGATQFNAPWGLDRIDQRPRSLDRLYNYAYSGAGVNVYVIDTGIRPTHQEFQGRAFIGADFVGDGRNGNDCNGHGTHVAGTVGGRTYGVAKGVRMYAVRVLDCAGSGSVAGVIAGVDWVTQHRVLPAVANMSLGGGGSVPLDTAVRNSIQAGVTYAVAAGNSGADASNFSPARVQEALTVGATDQSDTRVGFSNYGAVLDLFAPGVQITSAWIGSDTAINTISGTSMAAPHGAGVAALFLQSSPGAPPATVGNALRNAATPNIVSNPGVGSPNRLLFSQFRLPQGVVALYRYWNAGIGDHFYTTNFSELGSGGHGWILEGVQAYVYPTQASGTVPLYRYWNAGIGDHFYTTNFSELGSGGHGWILEGVQAYVF